MKECKIKSLVEQCRNSCFSLNCYQTSIGLRDFPLKLSLHTDYNGVYTTYKEDKNYDVSNIDYDAYLKRMTPLFQRDNNKWNKNMKIKFVENILKGAKVEILFYKFSEDEDGQIIDGLQRTTALLDFFQNRIKVFGEFYYKDLKDSLNKFSTNIYIREYVFQNWEQVGRFYIDINENITHSKSDIQKAKDWFLKEKNIVL